MWALILWRSMVMNSCRHVAIIMDGNGRWAKKQNRERTYGHTVGVENVRNIAIRANDLGMEALTVYAFSTENWKRPQGEVDFLMELFGEYLAREIEEMHRENVRVCFLGRILELAPSLVKQIREAQELTAKNSGIRFNIAANYGGQDELIRVALKIHHKLAKGSIAESEVTPALLEGELDTKDSPPVDLMIRTGGELRLSNFLLWQSAYAEFWFTQTNWPDFTIDEFQKALAEFAHRKRRFGGL